MRLFCVQPDVCMTSDGVRYDFYTNNVGINPPGLWLPDRYNLNSLRKYLLIIKYFNTILNLYNKSITRISENFVDFIGYINIYRLPYTIVYNIVLKCIDHIKILYPSYIHTFKLCSVFIFIHNLILGI